MVDTRRDREPNKIPVKQLALQGAASKSKHIRRNLVWEERHEKCSCSKAISGYLEFMETFYRLGMYISC